MGEMVSLEKVMCRSGLWRSFARRVVLPWALQGTQPSGTALEIGAGSGVMAEELLRRFDDLDLTATDFDRSMLEKGRPRLENFGPRVQLEVVDATGLPYEDDSFDFVFSFIMLHHVMEWEKALAEALRVLRPGGWLVGYDITENPMVRFLHRLERAAVRPMRVHELSDALDELPLDRGIVVRSGGAPIVRFRLRKR